jgi:hypothetical protein
MVATFGAVRLCHIYAADYFLLFLLDESILLKPNTELPSKTGKTQQLPSGPISIS